jgi:hypothetical protein
MNVAQSTFVTISAVTRVGERGALARMETRTAIALLAVSHGAKRLASRCCRVDADMGPAALVVVAARILEVLTRWRVVGRRFV